MSQERSAAFKRLIRKYEFLLEDWQDVQEISKSANQEMMREINMRKPSDITEDDFTVEEVEEEKEREEETPQDIILKKLFRKIVFKSHPDRLGDDISELERVRLVSLYEHAVSAHDDKNWALMVITAIKLDVELPEEAEEMVDQIEEEAVELEEKIANETNGIAWQYYHAVEEEKEKIVERYLQALLGSKQKKKEEGSKPSKLILGVGHPRTGTGYTAKLLQSWGLDVGHEKMGEDGTVDWSLSSGDQSLWQDVNFKDFDWKHIIYCVRDPRESIPSIVYTEDVFGTSFNFRKKYSIKNRNNPIEQSIDSINKWDSLIESLIDPDFIFKIESNGMDLFDRLKSKNIKIYWDSSNIGSKYNSRAHPTWEDMISEFGEISNKHKIKINSYCIKYGYKLIY